MAMWIEFQSIDQLENEQCYVLTDRVSFILGRWNLSDLCFTWQGNDYDINEYDFTHFIKLDKLP